MGQTASNNHPDKSGVAIVTSKGHISMKKSMSGLGRVQKGFHEEMKPKQRSTETGGNDQPGNREENDFMQSEKHVQRSCGRKRHGM